MELHHGVGRELLDPLLEFPGRKLFLGDDGKPAVHARRVEVEEERLEDPAVVGALAIEVGGRVPRHDRLEVRRPGGCDKRLNRPEVRHADHPDVPVAPRLAGDPLDEVVAVFGLPG